MTTQPIRTWADAYLAMKRRFEAVRGFVEVNPDTPDAVRWPRTTGHDAIFIAATLDRALRYAPQGFGSDGIHRRWHACLDDLERFGWSEPHSTYVENRELWSCALAVCVHLDAVDSVPPGAAFWDGFFVQIEHGDGHRNLDPGPFVTFDNVKGYDEMYIAQYKYLRDARGADSMPQPTEKVGGFDVGGGTFPVPRTTNSDVLQLATYWSKALALAKGKQLFGGLGTVKTAAWGAVLDDVAKYAKGADPNAVYPRNNIFWRVMEDVSTQVSVTLEAPTRMDLALGALSKSISNLPENLVKEIEWIGGKTKEVVVGIAGAAGDATSRALSPLLGSITTPLLIAGGGLAALFLLTRDRGHHGEP